MRPCSTSRRIEAAVKVFVTLAIRKVASARTAPAAPVQLSPGALTASATPGYVGCRLANRETADWSRSAPGDLVTDAAGATHKARTLDAVAMAAAKRRTARRS